MKDDDMLPEYDLRGGVRGKYAARYHATNDKETTMKSVPSAKEVDDILKNLEKGEVDIAEDLAKARDVAKVVFQTVEPHHDMIFGVFDRMFPSNMARIDAFQLASDDGGSDPDDK